MPTNKNESRRRSRETKVAHKYCIIDDGMKNTRAHTCDDQIAIFHDFIAAEQQTFIAYLLTLRRHKYLPWDCVSSNNESESIFEIYLARFFSSILIMLWPLKIDATIDVWFFLCFAAFSAYRYWRRTVFLRESYAREIFMSRCIQDKKRNHGKTAHRHTSKMCS